MRTEVNLWLETKTERYKEKETNGKEEEDREINKLIVSGKYY